MKKYWENKALVISAGLLLFYFIITVLASVIAPYDPLQINPDNVLKVHTASHLLGTDEFGRDVYSRLLLGLRPSMIIAITSTLLAMLAGSALGLYAAYAGKAAEQMIMRIIDVILCFPPMVLAVMIVGFWGASTQNLILTISISFLPTFARLAYASTLKVKNLEYIEAQMSLGASGLRVITTGILPNIFAPLLVQMSLTFGNAILLESGLSFLGMGVVPPAPSMGQMIGAAKAYLDTMPTLLIWPAAVLAVLILSINIFGDSLRDVLDPRLKRN